MNTSIRRVAERVAILLMSAVLIFLASACSGSQTPTAPSLSSMPVEALNTKRTVADFAITPDLASCVREPSPACFSAPRVSALLRLDSPVLSAPINLSSDVIGNTVTLSWTAPAGTPTAYILEAGSGAGLANIASFSTGNPVTTFTAANVPQGTYFVRVRALDSTLIPGPPSNEVLIVVGGCAAPSAPSGLLLTLNSGGTIALRWDPASGAPTSYLLEAGSAPGLANLASVDVGATTTFTAAGLGGGTYYVRVRARNGCGASAPGNEIAVTVAAVPMPGAPVLDTPERVYAFLRGKTIVQAGSDVPEYPNGVHESVACISRVTLIFLDAPGTWQVTVQGGTITVNNTCNKNVVSNTFGPFVDNYVVSGVQQNAACFNIDVRGANQSGRGSIDPVNRTVSWELYQNALNPANHRCANGPPGARGVSLGGASFQGNALQVWRY